ncbi:hypothetical protein [Hyphomonas sp.]|uniref:hypothetical protein n=1 Tax=Hyphomonas sp. TaxID=87 RepID=UPI00391C47F0
MTAQITEARLLELIECWGADTLSWPEAERASAEALLAAHPDRFANALAAARALDAAFDALPEAVPSAALTEAILAAAPRPRRKAARGWLGLKTPWAPASGFAAAVAGLMMGLTMAPAASAADEIDTEVQELVISALGFDVSAFALEADE